MHLILLTLTPFFLLLILYFLQLLQEYLERALDMLVETATTDAAYDDHEQQR